MPQKSKYAWNWQCWLPIQWLQSIAGAWCMNTPLREMRHSKSMALSISKVERPLNSPISLPCSPHSKISICRKVMEVTSRRAAQAHARLHPRPGLWVMTVCRLCHQRPANTSRMAPEKELVLRVEGLKTLAPKALGLPRPGLVSQRSRALQMLDRNQPQLRAWRLLYVFQSSPWLHLSVFWLFFSPRRLGLPFCEVVY